MKIICYFGVFSYTFRIELKYKIVREETGSHISWEHLNLHSALKILKFDMSHHSILCETPGLLDHLLFSFLIWEKLLSTSNIPRPMPGAENMDIFIELKEIFKKTIHITKLWCY